MTVPQEPAPPTDHAGRLPRPFAGLWLGEAITVLGDRALGVALPYLVFQQTNSLAATALLALTGYLPGLLFGSLAGVLADRWDRRATLIRAQLVQGLIILLLATGPEPLGLITAVIFAVRTLNLLAMPAGAALLPDLVGESQLARAIALLSVGHTSARLLGPVMGGLLVSTGGLRAVVWVDALSFFLAALCFTTLPSRAAPSPQTPPATLLGTWQALFREWHEGLGWIVQQPLIRTLFLVVALTSLGGTLVDPYYTPYLLSVLRASSADVGALSTLIGAGTLCGSLIATRVVPRFALGHTVASGTLLVGTVMVVLYRQTSLGPVFLLGTLLGLPMVVANVASSTLLQLGTPAALRGRMYGALGTTTALMGVLTTGSAALIGNRVMPVPMLTLAAILTLLAGLIALRLRRMECEAAKGNGSRPTPGTEESRGAG
jgi:predicted MFS family arabinose efflux permease